MSDSHRRDPYNSVGDIGVCLRALAASEGEVSLNAVVVDNASTDGTAELVARDFPDVQLIKNERNVYYAAACNQGAQTVEGDYVLLLNPDVQVAPNSLRLMIEYIEKTPYTASVAPKLVYPDGRVQQSVRRFPSYATLWYEMLGLGRLFPKHLRFGRWRMNLDGVEQPVDVNQPMASCLLIRRAMWDELGGFDEQFPMFFNDVDLCYRIKRAGARIVYLPQVTAVHRLGRSVRPVMPRMVWFSHLGFLRYLRKYHDSSFDSIKYLLSVPLAVVVAGLRSIFWLFKPRRD